MEWPFLFIAALYSLLPVSVSIYPAVSMAPASFRLTVGVPRHEANRAICYSVEGPELKRSCFTLDGNLSRRTWTVYWTFKAPGEYQATAVLTRIEDGKEKQYRDVRPFQVLGME